MPSRSIRSRADRLFTVAVLASIAAVSLPVWVAPALADPGADDVRKAREHYKRGEEAFAAERYEDAYRAFEAGYALVPRAVFLLNMAHAERRRGQLPRALALYKKYLVVEPESKYRDEVEGVIRDIEAAIAADDAARARAATPVNVMPVRRDPAPALVEAGTTRSGEQRPVYQRWWFWAGGGAAVAAAVITAVVLSSGGDASYERRGSLGTLGKP